MFKHNVYCLSVNGGSITDQAMDHILDEIQEMFRKNDKRVRFRNKDIGLTGEATTQYKYASLIGLSGIEVSVNYDDPGHSVKAVLIVKPCKKWKTIRKGRTVIGMDVITHDEDVTLN